MTTEPDLYGDPMGMFVGRIHNGVDWTPYVIDRDGRWHYHEPSQPGYGYSSLLVAGWHPDPSSLFAQRYFDGDDWTDRVIDVYGAEGLDVGETDAPSMGPTSGPAIQGHAFLSYAREDRWYVDNLVGHLHGGGIPTWSDAGIEHGTEWEEAIEAAMHQAFAVVLVVSEAAKRSRWVKRELYLADQLRLPVLPLLLDGPMWWRVGEAHHEDVGGGRLPGPAYVQQLQRWAASR